MNETLDTSVATAWNNVVTALGTHAGSLGLRPGASDADIAAAEAALGVALPDDYKAWLRLHDGQDHVQNGIDWLPASGRLLPLAVTLERWRDEQEWVDPNDEGFKYGQDDRRIRCVIRHPKRIVIAGNLWGDGDNTYLDLVPGTDGVVGQVIVAVTECDFLVVANSFLDFLQRWSAAFGSGKLTVTGEHGFPRVDLARKEHPADRWESALRDVAPLGRPAGVA